MMADRHVAASRPTRLPLIRKALAAFAVGGIAGQRLIAGGLLGAGEELGAHLDRLDRAGRPSW